MSSNGKKQLASGWREAPLGDMLTILRGVSYKKQDATTEPAAGKIPILRATNIDDGKLNFTGLVYVPQEYVSKVQLLNVGDIVIAASSGSRHVVGKAASLTVPWTGSFGAFCYGLRPHLQGTASYISLFLQTSIYRDHVSELSAGININNLRREHIEGVPLPVAPLNEQRRIVAKIEELFSELDKGIESLKTARAQLNVYRQAVLKHAFEGKLTAQWREENKDKLETPEQLLARIKQEREARYEQQVQEWKAAVKKWEEGGKSGKKPQRPKKLSQVADLFHDVTAKLPPLPESWIWEKLGWMTCGVEYGTAAKSATTGRVPVLRMGNIQNAKFDWADLVYTSDDNEIAEYLLHDGDVLFNRTNSPELVGKTAIYRGERPAVFAGYLIRVNHIRTVVNGQYLNLFLNSHVARQYGNNVKTDGVNQSNINGAKLSNYPFPYCLIEEQHEIAGILEKTLSLLDETEANIVQELRKSVALRQSILKKAFAGQLVEQDPHDEPASVLLDRIKAEREKAMKNNHSKKTKKRKTTA